MLISYRSKNTLIKVRTLTREIIVSCFFTIFLALEKTGIHIDAAHCDTVAIQTCLSQWRAVVAFYSLRLLLAPVVETVIQLDRLLFLAENGKIWLRVTTVYSQNKLYNMCAGLRGCLLPLFDCRTLPRNFALLCVKPPSSPVWLLIQLCCHLCPQQGVVWVSYCDFHSSNCPSHILIYSKICTTWNYIWFPVNKKR